MIIAAALMAGGCFGSTLVLKLSPDLIRKLFKVLLVIIALKMFLTENPLMLLLNSLGKYHRKRFLNSLPPSFYQ